MTVHHIAPGRRPAGLGETAERPATGQPSGDFGQGAAGASGQVVAIDHGLPPERLALIQRRPCADRPLRLIALGQRGALASGVGALPALLGLLDDLPLSMTIAAEGPGQADLARRIAPFCRRVRLLEPVAPPAAARLFASHDVFVLTSAFPGFGLSLVEAMATGCVPVAARIQRVSELLVEPGATGQLFELGDLASAAAAIRALAGDRATLAQQAATAAAAAKARFVQAGLAPQYAALIDRLTQPAAADAPTAAPGAEDAKPRRARAGWRAWRPLVSAGSVP